MSETNSPAPAPGRGRFYKYVFLIACAGMVWHVLQVEDRSPRQVETPAAYPATQPAASGKAVVLDARSFDQTVAAGIHVVDFWADWCGPCRTQGPIIDRFARNHAGQISVGKVDVDKEGQLANRFGIRSIPTILVIKDGEVAARFVGVTDEATLTSAVRSLR